VTAISITRAGPLTTVQDAGRFGMLRHGVSASGPMDRAAFERAAGWMGGAGRGGIEFTTAGLGFVVEDGSVGIGFDGGGFRLAVNGDEKGWPARIVLKEGDAVEITPAAWGNYGYLRFDRELELPELMGSLSTNSVAGLGGLDGRGLKAGDRLAFGSKVALGIGGHPRAAQPAEEPVRVLWGLHADLFAAEARQRFAEAAFAVSTRIDRMGARLEDRADVFAGTPSLSLVSDAIVPGDIQILGDGTPIVLMRDHQPTGGYPRIATVITADLDRLAQLRPGTEVRFEPVSLTHAHALRGQRG
jgi:5-oxoprolinase (ATP-hydrolysing) subunit C